MLLSKWYVVMFMFISCNAHCANLSKIFHSAAKGLHISEKLLSAVCYVESNHSLKIRKTIDNGQISYGICQIRGATARSVGFKGSFKQLENPHINIRIAAKILAKNLKKYHYDWRMAVTAYNRGSFKPGTRKNNLYTTKVALAMLE